MKRKGIRNGKEKITDRYENKDKKKQTENNESRRKIEIYIENGILHGRLR